MPFQYPEAYYNQAGQVPLDMSGEFQSEGVPDPRSFGVVANTPNPLEYISQLMGRGQTIQDANRVMDTTALLDRPAIDVEPPPTPRPKPPLPTAPNAARPGTTTVEPVGELPPNPANDPFDLSRILDFEAGALGGSPGNERVLDDTAGYNAERRTNRNLRPVQPVDLDALYGRMGTGQDITVDPSTLASASPQPTVPGANTGPFVDPYARIRDPFGPAPETRGAQNPIRALIMELLSGLGGGESSAVGSADSAHAGDPGRQKALSEAERRQKDQGK
jgi:hypothetical protein